uniref:DUF4266 domain-containing protein n=1 Tax=Ningiella ruwaisensis TaxID=2364274 RepID=UPI0010A018F2|nr:DUF4266 domain-containing protein [Ningiella ruwaisensis]
MKLTNSPQIRKVQTIAKASLLIALVSLGGCASTFGDGQEGFDLANFKLEPWVKPYERSNLADPIMSVNRNPIALAYAKHVNESREGARGADGGAGGGCGCN